MDNERRSLFPQVGETDSQRLGEALRGLVKRGSLLREVAGQRDLYDWCQLNRDWLEDAASLLDLRIIWEHESRLIVAVPQSNELIRRLKLDETLVFLVLWYDLDTAVREEGLPDVQCEFTIAQLNDSFATKFGDGQQPSPSRLRQILSLGEKLQLVQVAEEPELARSRVTVLPTLRHVLPFAAMEEWSRHAQAYREMTENPANTAGETSPLAPESASDQPNDHDS